MEIMHTMKESEHRSLTINELFAISWYRNLSEEDKALASLVLAALKKNHQSLNLIQGYAAA